MKKSQGSGRVKIDLYGPGESAYVVGVKGANSCPENSIPITASMDDCLRAGKTLGVDRTSPRPDGWTGESGDVPPYCSYQSGGDQAIHFNTISGNNSGGYTPICLRKVNAADYVVGEAKANDCPTGSIPIW